MRRSKLETYAHYNNYAQTVLLAVIIILMLVL